MLASRFWYPISPVAGRNELTSNNLSVCRQRLLYFIRTIPKSVPPSRVIAWDICKRIGNHLVIIRYLLPQTHATRPTITTPRLVGLSASSAMFSAGFRFCFQRKAHCLASTLTLDYSSLPRSETLFSGQANLIPAMSITEIPSIIIPPPPHHTLTPSSSCTVAVTTPGTSPTL